MILQTTSFPSNFFPSSQTLYSFYLTTTTTTTTIAWLLLLLLLLWCAVLCYALPYTSQSITIETLQRNHQKYFAKYNRFGVLITSEFRLFLFFFVCLQPSSLVIPLIHHFLSLLSFLFHLSFLFFLCSLENALQLVFYMKMKFFNYDKTET